MRADMGLVSQLMALLRSLRRPHEKPADLDVLDSRLDEVERRLMEVRRRRLQTEYDTMRRQ